MTAPLVASSEAYRPFRSIRSTLTAWLELARLVVFVLLFGGRYALRRIQARGVLPETIRGEVLRDLLIALGPAWIKIGQILSTRADLLPAGVVVALSPLRDRVPPMPSGVVERILAAAYPEGLPFRDFDRMPVSAASVAQVHRAVLADGTPLAIKIVRPGIRAALERDIAILIGIARGVARFRLDVRSMQIPQRLLELRVLLIRQADMLREARDMSAIRSSMEGHPFVRIPSAYPDLSRDNVLVMEFMNGVSGADPDRVSVPRRVLATRLVEAMQTMIYMHGQFHADAHPGNIFFSNSGKIILLDFGIVGEISEAERWALASFYFAVIRKQWAVAARRYTRAFAVNRTRIEERWPEFEARMVACLRTHFESRTQWDTAAFTRDTVNLFEAYGSRESTQWAQIELALVSLEGFVASLDPTLDLWEASRRFTERYSLYLGDGMRELFDAEFASTIPRSLAASARAHVRLVAPTHLDRYFVPAAYPLCVTRALGSRITDLDGNEYVELHGGYGTFILGYAHPAVEAAISRVAREGNVCAVANLEEIDLMEQLIAALPGAERGLFASSGTEACQIAMKLCRTARRRTRVAKCEGHYHGFSDHGTVSSWFRVDGPVGHPLPIAGSAGVDPAAADSTLVLQYGHPDSLEELRKAASELACVFVEPMPASLVSYDQDWLASLRSICDETGVPLVFDEVVTGFRVAYGGMQSVVGIRPDLTVLGKIIGGGLPCGAVVGKARLIDCARSTGDPFEDYEERAFVGGTFAGNRLTCAAGRAHLQTLQDDPEVYSRLQAMTHLLADGFKEVINRRSVACQLAAERSIFTMSFRPRPPRYYRERFSGSDVRANLALAYFMRRAGVYMAELHTYFIGAAHSETDLGIVIGAFDRSIELMQAKGVLA